MDAGILPVRSPDGAKRRLAADLEPAMHAAVVGALIEDALDLCVATDVLRWFVVSNDEKVLDDAVVRGLVAVRDGGTGLNPALEIALDAALSEGAESALVIPSDLPLARPEDVEDIVDTGATSDIVVVPSGRDGGTNALFMSPPDLLHPSFGSASLQAHLDAASAASLRCVVFPSERLALDIDTIDDARELVKRTPEDQMGRTERLLRNLLTQ